MQYQIDSEITIPTESMVLPMLGKGAPGEWQEFFDTYYKLIYRTARRACLSPQESERVTEETLLTIGRQIINFQDDPSQNSFKSWLRSVTISRIQDCLEDQRKHSNGRSTSRKVSSKFEPRLDPQGRVIAREWEADWESNLSDAALDRVRKKIAPKQFQIFDLAILRHWPSSRIAKALNVSVGYVYLVKHRVSLRLWSELRRLRRRPWEKAGLAASA